MSCPSWFHKLLPKFCVECLAFSVSPIILLPVKLLTYALLQFLPMSPSLKVLFIEGIIFPLTEVRSIAVPPPPELYACPLIVLTLKSFTNILRHRFNDEPKSELLVSKGIMLPLTLILVVLISRIYALLQFLLVSPNLKVLSE